MKGTHIGKVMADTGRTTICAQMAVTIREVRVRKGLAQLTLAERSGVGRRSIGGIERGKQVPTIEMIERIGLGLGLDYERLSVLAAHHALPAA